MRRLLTLLALVAATAGLVVALLLVIVWAPPLFSGALLLLWQPPQPPRPAAVNAQASDYKPLHQGHVDTTTGLYIREDEDLVLTKTPMYTWRRTYLSGDHVSRQFGVGATDNANWYLIGDPARFQWAELVRDDGSRIHFDRLTPGHTYANAVYGHVSTPTEFFGGLLGWVGDKWALRLRNSRVLLFQGCGGRSSRTCALVQIRLPDGDRITFTRDQQELLRTINTGSEQLTFEYDDRHRIVKAFDTVQHAVEYTYDAAGRVARAVSNGAARLYTYGAADELLTIREPGRFIENRYDASGRLSYQTVHRPNRPDYREAFAYTVATGSVIETDVTEDDGSRTQYRFDEHHRTMLESYDSPRKPPVMVSFDYGPGGFVWGLTIRCTKNGRAVTATASIRPAEENRVKAELIEEKCDPSR